MATRAFGGLTSLFVTTTSHRFLAATFTFGHECRVPATEGAGKHSLLVERGHRDHESREGGLEHYPSQGSFRLRQHPPHNDQSTLSPPVISCPGLTIGQDSMANELDYVELGLTCANICGALNRGMNGRRLDELSQSACDAINQLTT